MTRRGAFVGVVASLAVGAASRLVPAGVALWDKSAGDVAYATLIGFVGLLVFPRARPVTVGAITIAVCFAVELFQLTGIAARGPRIMQLVLGTTFAWHDLACYAVGGALVALVAHARFRATRTPR